MEEFGLLECGGNAMDDFQTYSHKCSVGFSRLSVFLSHGGFQGLFSD